MRIQRRWLDGLHLRPLSVKHCKISCARKKREVRAMFEVMANLTVTNEGTPSMIDRGR